MRDDAVRGITAINCRLENLHSLPGNFGTSQAANQLFTLAGKHWPDDHFNPTHVAFDDVHASPLCLICLSWSAYSRCCAAALPVVRIRRSSPIETGIKEWRKCIDQCHAKSILPRNQISREHAPCTLGITNVPLAGKSIDGDAKLDALVHNPCGQGFRQQDAAGLTVRAVTVSIGYVRPVLKEDQTLRAVRKNIKAALEPHEELPQQVEFSGSSLEDLRAVLGASHRLCARLWSVRDATRDFFSGDFESSIWIEQRTKSTQSFPQGVQLRLARRADCDDYL